MATAADLERALLDDVIAHPAEDAPRLILADWWQERGEEAQAELRRVREELAARECAEYWCDRVARPSWPAGVRCDLADDCDAHRRREAELAPVAALADRAEFIRVQCRIAALEAGCGCGRCVRLRGGGQHTNGPCAVDRERDTLADGSSRQAFLRRRERALLLDTTYPYWHERNNWRERSWGCYVWGPPPGMWHLNTEAWTFRRGFVASVHAPLAALLEHLPALARAHPLEKVRATDRRPSTSRHGVPGARKPFFYAQTDDALYEHAHWLPACVVAGLRGGAELRSDLTGVVTAIEFDSEAEADAALGRALLALARG